jgi:hypothetical protein
VEFLQLLQTFFGLDVLNFGGYMVQFRLKRLWRSQVTLKTKAYLWFLCHGVILIKDNVVKQS